MKTSIGLSSKAVSPKRADNPVTNRGPYDTVFGWRNIHLANVGRLNPDPQDEQITDNFSSPWSGGSGRSSRWLTSNTVVSYTTFGTWQWLKRFFHDRGDGTFADPGALFNSAFVLRVNRMGDNKLNTIWPVLEKPWVFRDPNWITNYGDARALIAAGSPQVAYTQFIRMDFEQTFINDVPTTSEPVLTDWSVLRPRGGRLRVPGARKTGDYTWQDTAKFSATSPDGTEFRRVLTREFVWAGINIGRPIELRNPNNFEFEDRDDLAAPIDFDHDAMTRPEGGMIGQPGEPFSVLGIAKQPNTAPMWPGLFQVQNSGYNGHVAIAQACVFNNHSWDLWTQMWHAQLEPVQDFSGWIRLMQSSSDSLDQYPDIDTDEAEAVIEYLRSVEELAPILLNH